MFYGVATWALTKTRCEYEPPNCHAQRRAWRCLSCGCCRCSATPGNGDELGPERHCCRGQSLYRGPVAYLAVGIVAPAVDAARRGHPASVTSAVRSRDPARSRAPYPRLMLLGSDSQPQEKLQEIGCGWPGASVGGIL